MEKIATVESVEKQKEGQGGSWDPPPVLRYPPTSCVQSALSAHSLVVLGEDIGSEELGEGIPLRWLWDNPKPQTFQESFCLEEASTLL